MSGKHFSCECVRCRDPTELKSFASAVLCGCGGTVLAADPLDLTQDARWNCQECSQTLAALQVASQEVPPRMVNQGVLQVVSQGVHHHPCRG